ncbi:unnamed protein product [Arabidopsis thaliana]|nr:unnamed protein product [Arabidopsis thaliana]
MIERNWPVAEVWSSIVRCSQEFVGKSDDGVLFGILFDGYIAKGYIEEAVFVFSSSMGLELVPRLSRCKVLLDALLRWNRLDLFWDVYKGMVERNVVFDVKTYHMLIIAHCRAGNVQLGKDVLFKTEKEFRTATLNVDGAIKLKESMICKGLVPLKYTYDVLIDGLCKIKRLEDAKSLLVEMDSLGVSLDNHTYSLLIDGLLKGRNADAAKGLVHEMVSHGINIKPYMYDCCICVMSKEGVMEKAKALFDGMIASGLTPQAQAYASLIEGYCREKNVRQGYELLVEMKKRNIVISPYTYGTVVKGMCSSGDLDGAYNIVKEMIASVPDSFVYTTLVDGCCRLNDVERAITIFGTNKKGCASSTAPFNALINWVFKFGKTELKTEVLNRLMDGSFDRFGKPNDVTYNIMIDYLCKEGNLEAAKELFHQMQNANLMPTVITYTSLLNGYDKMGRRAEMFPVFDEAIAAGIEPDNIMYSVIINAFLKEGMTTKALVLVDQMFAKNAVDDGCKLSISTCRALLSGFAKVGEMEVAEKVMENMVRLQYIPDSATVIELINESCISSNQRVEADAVP